MSIKTLLLIFLVSVLSYVATSQTKFRLTDNGKSDYKIVVATNATAIEKNAAAILQQYIIKISDCALPVVNVEGTAEEYQIIVGRSEKVAPSELAGLGIDGVLIKRIKNTLILSGGTRKGVLYSVFTFLEDYLGCQYYDPESIEVPPQKIISLPAIINKRQTPSFFYRTTDYANAFSHEYCDWRKLNYFYEDWGLWVHSFKTLLPESEYFAVHPEYFALINGQRNPVQPDLTNPDVFNIVLQNLKKLIKNNPAAKYWSVSQNDSQTNLEHCECPKCKKLDEEEGSPQGSLLSFVNAIAKQLPGVIISTLAYGYSERPPKNLKAEKNVMVMLTDLSVRDRSKPIPSQSVKFNRYFKQWAVTTSHLFIWDYTVQFAHVLLPFPNISTFQPNIQMFASGNAEYIFEEGHGNIAGEFSELRSYLLSKLMWNKSESIKSTTNRFLNHYYGKVGAFYIRSYLALLENKATDRSLVLYPWENLTSPMNSYLSLRNINGYKKIFQNALSKLDSNSVFWRRVLKEYCCVVYADVERIKYLLNKKDLKQVTDRKSWVVLNDWYKNSKLLNIRYTSESRISIDDYYKNVAFLLKENGINSN